MSCLHASKAHFVGLLSVGILTTLVTPVRLTGEGRPSTRARVGVATQDARPPLFLPVAIFGSGGLQAASVVGTDLNGDGKPDLVVSNTFSLSASSGSVGVLLGHGDGTFEPAVAYDPGGDATASAAVADVNSDGKPDLLAVNECATLTCSSNGSVGLLLGNGDGTFQTAITFDSGAPVSNSIAVADVNRDGNPDLVIGNFNTSVTILLGDGRGNFHPGATYSSEGEFSVAVADLNGDGNPDLMVANLFNDLAVRLGNGDGTLQAPVIYDPGGFDVTSVSAKDLNGDGNVDLVVSNWFANNQDFQSNGVVGVLLGNGDGTFKPAVIYDSGGQQPSSIGITDANGDGKLDLVAANCASIGSGCNVGPSVAAVLLGNGDGTFQVPLIFDSGGTNALSIAAADVNRDGETDLLVANLCGSSGCGQDPHGLVGVLLNNAADTTPPIIALSVDPRVLWPPNGKLMPVTLSGTITDSDSGMNLNSAAYAVLDEYGEVQSEGPVSLDPAGNYSFTILLQASRRGTDLNGRRYTIMIHATDNAGNVGSQTGAVTVPHDRRN
jgi:hypothetical protein